MELHGKPLLEMIRANRGQPAFVHARMAGYEGRNFGERFATALLKAVSEEDRTTENPYEPTYWQEECVSRGLSKIHVSNSNQYGLEIHCTATRDDELFYEFMMEALEDILPLDNPFDGFISIHPDGSSSLVTRNKIITL